MPMSRAVKLPLLIFIEANLKAVKVANIKGNDAFSSETVEEALENEWEGRPHDVAWRSPHLCS